MSKTQRDDRSDCDRTQGAGGGDGALEEVLAQYLMAADAGEAPDRERFIATHPELADALRAFFADESKVRAMATVAGAGVIGSAIDGGSADAPRVHSFGDYELIEEIGRGGMGVVYRALQVHLNRVVALKMILAGVFASAEDVKRFYVEAHNAADLDHPNIVPVYDVGRHRGGQHYFSMKLIEGGRLTASRFTGNPRGAARMLATVARAVHHAHQRGILHRDLKPGNILVDTRGQPHVTDFGLARRMTDDEGRRGLTLSGAVLGSPRYMAPEQARGEKGLSVAADVYSLGVILYELLTGRPPFSGETALDTLRLVREQDPARPSLVLPGGVDRDLETVALKCLEKDPQRRYASAEAFAEDLERWLRGEPIRARPSTALTRVRKWARRKPATAALVAVLVLSVPLSIAGLVLNNVLVAQERAIAVRERNAKHAALQAELALRKLAVGTLESLTDDVVRRQLARRPVLGPADRAFLARIASHYEAFVSSSGEARPVQAAGHFRLGLIRAELGELPEARASYERAITLYRQLVAASPENPEHRNELVGAYAQLARLLSKLGLRDDAEEMFRSAVSVGDQLVEQWPQRPQLRRNLAYAHNGLGGLLAKLGHHHRAAAEFERAIALDGQLAALYPDVPDYREFLANSHNGLGVALTELGKRDEAAAALRHALDMREHLVAGHPDDPKYRQTLIASYCNLAAALTGANAEVALRRAIALGDQLVAEYPAVPAYHSRLANAHNALGVTLSERGEQEKAKEAFGRAIELRTRVATMLPNTDDNAVRLGSTYGNMADLVRESGEPVRALEWYARAVETLSLVARREPRLRNVRRHLSRSLVGRSMAHADLERFADAVLDLDTVVEWNPAAGDGDDANRVVVSRARLLLNLSRLEQTVARHCRNLLVTFGPDRWQYVRNCARPYVGTGNVKLSVYRDLEWIRAGPPADGPSRDEPSTHEAD